MKSKIVVSLLLLSVLFSFAACGREGDPNQDSSKKSDTRIEEQKNDASDKEETEENAEETAQGKNENKTQTQEQQPDSVAQLEPETAMITVYYSNADATAFESSDVQIDSLSPEAVLKALVSKGALTADVEEKSFTISKVDDKETIELDLNQAFASYVSNMGTTGEYYTVGALVNTFLDSYSCEQIKITVEGGEFSTGHAEYPGYLTKFS